MRLLVVENDAASPLGLLDGHFRALGAEPVTVAPHRGEALPAGDFAGLVILGGAQSAEDDVGFPAFPAILDLIRAFHDADRPILGICLGAQLIARAFGARVKPMGLMEVGFPALRVVDVADPLLAGLAPVQYVMQWHEDAFDLPDGATLVLDGETCRNQAFRLGRATYGFQGHVEVGIEAAGHWLDHYREPILRRCGREGLARAEWELAERGAAAEDFSRILAARWIAASLRSSR